MLGHMQALHVKLVHVFRVITDLGSKETHKDPVVQRTPTLNFIKDL